MAPQPVACLTCHERIAYKRGCCMRCYHRHRNDVATGETTWAKLERRRLALPAQAKGSGWRQLR